MSAPNNTPPNPQNQPPPNPAPDATPTVAPVTPPTAEPPKSRVSPEFLKKAGIIPKDPPPAADTTPPPAPEPPPPAKPDATTPPAPDPEKPEPKPKKPLKVAKGYNAPANIEEITAAATAAATAAVKATAAQPPPPAPEPELNDEDKRMISVYETMASMKPDKYKELPVNAKRFVAELDRREREWRQANPDATEEFDADGEIAASLEKRFNLKFDEHDFRDAEIESRIAPLKTELENTKRKLEETETVLATETVQETVRAAVTEAKTMMKDELGFKDTDITKLADDDPYVGEVVQREMTALENFVAAAHIAFAGGEHPMAGQVGELCQRFEQNLIRSPAEDRLDENNRQFITRAQYLSLKPSERKQIDSGTHTNYWGMNAATAAAIGTQIILNRAKTQVEAEKAKADKLLERHGLKAKPTPPPAPQPVRQPTPAPIQPSAAPPAPRRPASPTSVMPSSQPNTGGNSAVPAPNFMKRFLGNAPIGGGITTAPGAK